MVFSRCLVAASNQKKIAHVHTDAEFAWFEFTLFCSGAGDALVIRLLRHHEDKQPNPNR